MKLSTWRTYLSGWRVSTEFHPWTCNIVVLYCTIYENFELIVELHPKTWVFTYIAQLLSTPAVYHYQYLKTDTTRQGISICNEQAFPGTTKENESDASMESWPSTLLVFGCNHFITCLSCFLGHWRGICLFIGIIASAVRWQLAWRLAYTACFVDSVNCRWGEICGVTGNWGAIILFPWAVHCSTMWANVGHIWEVFFAC